jgi:hypothetical protein
MSGLQALADLCGLYLHEDWALDGNDPWDVVDKFARDQPQLAQWLPSEIDEVLSHQPTEEQLKHLVHEELVCDYLPTAHGWTYRAWLLAIADRVGRPPEDHGALVMKELPALDHLLGLYFHQDWALEDDTPWDVVDHFVREEPQLAAGLSDEVDEVLSRQPTEEHLWHLVHKELICSYLPTADGWTYRAWLLAIADRVRRSAAKRTA